jgi:hypothetical protein
MLPLAIKAESARFLKVRPRATEEEGVAVKRKSSSSGSGYPLIEFACTFLGMPVATCHVPCPAVSLPVASCNRVG